MELLKVLIIPDKFKGTLPAGKAALAIARGWRRSRPQDELELLPLTDGGDGFGEAMAALLDARPRQIRAKNAAHQTCTVRWWWEPSTRTAIIESAGVIGLAMLPPGKRVPFELDSFGLGMLIRHMAKIGARSCIVGLGGSATNDAGFGLARALGWEFYDSKGRALTRWPELSGLGRIAAPRKRTWPKLIMAATDVRNRLLGSLGATRIYGPQKGLSGEELVSAERCLRNLSNKFERQTGRRCSGVPGAGAAGGLGFGLMAFCGARLQPGFSLFAHKAGLSRRLRKVDLVLTGEGRIDRSTFMGKGVGAIAQLCRQKGIPCIGFAGEACGAGFASRGFSKVRTLTELATAREAKQRASYWLERLAAATACDFEALSRRSNGVRSRP